MRICPHCGSKHNAVMSLLWKQVYCEKVQTVEASILEKVPPCGRKHIATRCLLWKQAYCGNLHIVDAHCGA